MKRKYISFRIETCILDVLKERFKTKTNQDLMTRLISDYLSQFKSIRTLHEEQDLYVDKFRKLKRKYALIQMHLKRLQGGDK